MTNNLFTNKQSKRSYLGIEMPIINAIDLWQDREPKHLTKLNNDMQNIEVLSSSC